MKKNRRLYFLKSTGDILFDTGEVTGDIKIKETSFDEDIRLGGLGNLPKKDIDFVEIPYGHYKKEFLENDCCKIDSDTKKLRFLDRKYIIQKYEQTGEFYSKNKIDEFYKEHYMFNIKNLARATEKIGFKYKWLTLDEIIIKPTILSKTWDVYFKDDQYLVDSVEDKTVLAKDIIENGTFWPIVVQDLFNGSYMTSEGSHRIISLKLLDMYEDLKNFKILSLVIDDTYESYKHSNITKILETPIVQRIPFVCKYKSFKKNDEKTRDNMEANGYEFVDDDKEVMEFKAKTYTELIYANQIWPHWLRDIFYKAKETYNYIVKGDELINNEESWNLMMEEE